MNNPGPAAPAQPEIKRGEIAILLSTRGRPDMLLVKRTARRQSGGWWLASIDAPAWTLFALVGGAMIVFGLSTAASIRLTRWGK